MIEPTGEIVFIPDRLNEEPVVFLAMTNSEIKMAALASLGFWTPICLVVGVIVGKVLLALATVAALAYVSLWAIGKRLTILKRGKPKQYHVAVISGFLEDKGLRAKTSIRSSQKWSIRRSKSNTTRSAG